MTRKTMAALLVVCLLSLAGCGDSGQGVFQGYVEGEYVYLASSQAGRLESLAVERGSSVSARSLLFELEAEYERQVLRQAEEEELSARAQLKDMETGKRPEEVAMARAQLEQARAEAANAARAVAPQRSPGPERGSFQSEAGRFQSRRQDKRGPRGRAGQPG